MSNSPRHWHHLILTTYGAWLPGDARGFRTRHHREHVDGDYRDPPPRLDYVKLRRTCNAQLKQEVVSIAAKWRPLLGEALIEKFTLLGANVLIVAVASQHVHLLAKLRPADVRKFSGMAKKHSTFTLHNHRWTGLVWGRRGKVIRIRDRQHQVNTFRYILRHRQQGAWVKDLRLQFKNDA